MESKQVCWEVAVFTKIKRIITEFSEIVEVSEDGWSIYLSNLRWLPQPLTVGEGSVARFSCQIKAVPDALINWEKNKKKLESNSRITVQPSGVLQIYNIKKSDAGKYRCVASNIAGRKRSSAAQLTVKKKVSAPTNAPILLSPAFQKVIKKQDETAILECLASGNVKPSLSWIREDGGSLPTERISQIGQGTLVISSLKPSDAGVYICTVSSKDPETQEILTVSQSTRLRVLVPPDIVFKPESLAKPMSITARFKCHVEGMPTPKVVWLKNGKPLTINGRIKTKGNSVLIVAQTVASDSGIYQCMTSNRAGTATAAARLHVNTSSDQPSAPGIISATTISSTSILVKWKNSTSPRGLHIQAYSLHCFPSEGGKEMQRVSSNTSKLFDNLEPYTNYTFYVRAYNGRSASPQSKRISQMTGEDVSIGAPSITVTSTKPTSLHISWEELSTKIARGKITGYKIFYRLNGEASNNVIEIVDSAKQYTITELQSGGTYDVRVLASTKFGFPILSDQEWPWVTHKLSVLSSKKIPHVPELFISSLNSTSVLIQWRDTPSKQIIDGYKLSYRKQSHLLQGPISLSNFTDQYILEKLDPHSWYEIHFSAYNEHGDGPEAVRNILTSSDDNSTIIEPPSHLNAFPTSKSSIRLSWQPPSTSQGISYYTVSYHAVHVSSKDVKPQHIRSTLSSNQVEITDLEPFTLYEFAVQSLNENNIAGPFSQKAQCKTKQDVPSAPEDVHWTPVDANTVIINWQPPSLPNGIISKYHILYSSKTTDPQKLDAWQTCAVNGNLGNGVDAEFVTSETEAGLGSASTLIAIIIPAKKTPGSKNSTSIITETHPDASNRTNPANPRLGIIVGVSIAIICVVICLVIIICRSKCCPPTSQPMHGNVTYVMCKTNGHVPALNGNGYVINGKCHDGREIDSYAPMLMTSIPDASVIEGPLDTKGGYPVRLNNKVNNAEGNHHGNGNIVNRNSNHKPQVNITENPQFDDVRKSNPDVSNEVNDDVPRPSSPENNEDSLQEQPVCMNNQNNNKLDNSSAPLLSVSQRSQELTVDT
ncbi:Protogenin [Nymphon striatum]|nr:Protogenin [Nymphon striatum]